MSLEINQQGVRQDHRGQAYGVHVAPVGAQTHVPVEVEDKPFRVTLEHTWSWEGGRMTVLPCRQRATCKVCGPEHGAYYVADDVQ